MKETLYRAFCDAEANYKTTIAFRVGGKRRIRTFHEIHCDVCALMARLEDVLGANAGARVGIVGVTSYEWMLCDLACVFSGYHSVVFPEALPAGDLHALISDARPDIILADDNLLESIRGFRAIGMREFTRNLEQETRRCGPSLDRMDSFYSTAYTSGTTGRPKPLQMRFVKPQPTQGSPFKRLLVRIRFLIRNRNSFWRRSDNKILIFMPFSHRQQREFVQIALIRKIHIVLSDPLNCFLDLVREKPNIMVAVPKVYETLAEMVRRCAKEIRLSENRWWQIYSRLNLHRLSKQNVVRRAVENRCLKPVKRIYGGKGDYFISGSAALGPEIMTYLSRMGLRIHQGYGVSEIGIMAMTSDKHWRAGSVGKPLMDLKIAENGEICVKFDERVHSREEVHLDEAGYIRTGDIGSIDSAGFLTVSGRLDNLIVLPNGKKILPEAVEAKWNASLAPAQSVLLSIGDELKLVILSNGVWTGRLRSADLNFPEWEWPSDFGVIEMTRMDDWFTGSGKPLRAKIGEACRETGIEWRSMSELVETADPVCAA